MGDQSNNDLYEKLAYVLCCNEVINPGTVTTYISKGSWSTFIGYVMYESESSARPFYIHFQWSLALTIGVLIQIPCFRSRVQRVLSRRMTCAASKFEPTRTKDVNATFPFEVCHVFLELTREVTARRACIMNEHLQPLLTVHQMVSTGSLSDGG
jgi:hypothetical protein